MLVKRECGADAVSLSNEDGREGATMAPPSSPPSHTQHAHGSLKRLSPARSSASR